MEIFEFIDSKSIREHLKSINYSFSNVEKSFLVYMSTKATIEQKHKAFKKIIASGKDEKIERRPNTGEYPSLFEFLKRYMEIENKIVEEFYNTKESIYRYRYLCHGDNSYCEDFETVFPNFDLCDKAFKDDIEDYNGDENLHFYEYRMDSLTEIGKKIILKFTPNNELLEIYATCLDEEQSNVLSAFDGMWFAFPTPFKKGDILISHRYNQLYVDKTPVVVESLSTWTKEEFVENECIKTEKEIERREYLYNQYKINGDISDLNIRGYFGCLDGTFFWEVSHSILDYDYYEGPFTHGYRILNVISDYIKDELDLDSMVKLAKYISDEEALKDSKRYIHLMDSYMDKLGI